MSNSTEALLAATAAAGGPSISTTDIDSGRAVSTVLMGLYILIPYLLSRQFHSSPSNEGKSHRTAPSPGLFFWLGFSSITHVIHESLYLFQCFFVSGIATAGTVNKWLPEGVYFLGQPDRVYGAHQGGPDSLSSLMWMDYSRADRRWAGSDPVLISLEMAMVMVGIGLGFTSLVGMWTSNGVLTKQVAVKVLVMSSLELLAGWIVFMPELLTDAPNLDLADPERLWFYLIVMNSLWVIFPIMAIRQAYSVLINDKCSTSSPSSNYSTGPERGASHQNQRMKT